MALLLVEGFDAYLDGNDTTRLYPESEGDGQNLNHQGGVRGGGAWFPDYDGEGEFRAQFSGGSNVNGTDHHIRCGFWIKTLDLEDTSDDYIFMIGHKPSSHDTVRIKSNFPAGTLSIDLTDEFDFDNYSNKKVNDGLWHWIEIYARRSDTQDYVELWIDDSLEVSVDRGSGTDSDFQIPFTWVILYGHTSDMLYDDLIVWNDEGSEFTGKQGPMMVHTDRPNGDGAQSDWTPRTGSDHAALVGDDLKPFAPSSVSELTTDTDGAIDLFTFPSLDPSDVSAVKAVEVSGAVSSSSGPIAEVAGVASVGGSTYAGNATPTDLGLGRWSSIFITNPDTGSAWDLSEVDNAEFGIKNRIL